MLRGGTEWPPPDEAVELVLAAQKASIPLLGFDGAYLTDAATEPSQADSWDYGSDAYPKVLDAYGHAVKFISDRRLKGLHFEIVLDRQIQ